MKKNKCFYIITFSFNDAAGNRKSFKPVGRYTYKGVSDYANRMYKKYCDKYDGIRVDYGHFDDDLNWHLDGTYA